MSEKSSYSYLAEVGLVDDAAHTQTVTGTALASSRREAIQTIEATLRARGMEPLDLSVDGQRA
ncbi:hypothetical protein OG249_37705 [Streptomyces microflavus]|uniref:hypothetical protein n=1 Tax=Streptomyces microflavus TaxID=1919 RepID=UPI00224D8C38|nr:hypothetical protein [Streptomyces microflavus]MCX4657596.1 hypothetical protein [Streptomyces microflavus]